MGEKVARLAVEGGVSHDVLVQVTVSEWEEMGG